MSIKFVEYHNDKHLIYNRLRFVTLENQTDECVYQNSRIDIQYLDVERLVPAQRYVLRQDLDRVKQLRHEVFDASDGGIDILRLDGRLVITFSDSDEPLDLLPPIVEVSKEHNMEQVLLVNDGMHRLYLAWLEWATPSVIVIKEASHPYYAYPIRGKSPWERVQIVDSFPEGFLKRWPRMGNKEESRKLFRNFDSMFNTKHARRR